MRRGGESRSVGAALGDELESVCSTPGNKPQSVGDAQTLIPRVMRGQVEMAAASYNGAESDGGV